MFFFFFFSLMEYAGVNGETPFCGIGKQNNLEIINKIIKVRPNFSSPFSSQFFSIISNFISLFIQLGCKKKKTVKPLCPSKLPNRPIPSRHHLCAMSSTQHIEKFKLPTQPQRQSRFQFFCPLPTCYALRCLLLHLCGILLNMHGV